MTTSNSAIFTSGIFGSGSAKTAEELADIARQAQEAFYSQNPTIKIVTPVIPVPSNQRIAKDK